MKQHLDVTLKTISVIPNGYRTRFSDGSIGKLSKKAMWSWGRIHAGRRKFDKEVKDIKEEILSQIFKDEDVKISRKEAEIKAAREAILTVFSETFYDFYEEQRPVQAFTDGLKVVSIATKIHSLFPPEKVMEIGQQVFDQYGIKPYTQHMNVVRPDQLLGLYDAEPSLNMNIGINFSAGDIYTNRAIFVGQFIEMAVCTNPIVWLRRMLGIYLTGTQLQWYAKILRLSQIENENILKKKIEVLVKDVMSGKKGIVALVQASKTKPLTDDMAETIIMVLTDSYGIGKKVAEEIFEEFLETGNTLYDLAQATSYVAWSSQNFRSDAERARNILSGISAVILSIKDPERAYELSRERIIAREAI